MTQWEAWTCSNWWVFSVLWRHSFYDAAATASWVMWVQNGSPAFFAQDAHLHPWNEGQITKTPLLSTGFVEKVYLFGMRRLQRIYVLFLFCHALGVGRWPHPWPCWHSRKLVLALAVVNHKVKDEFKESSSVSAKPVVCSTVCCIFNTIQQKGLVGGKKGYLTIIDLQTNPSNWSCVE